MYITYGDFVEENNPNRLLCFIFCSFLLINHCVTADICERIINADSVAWEDANERCQDNNGRMLDPIKTTIQELYKCNDNFNGAWVDRYTYFSPWIEIMGCYSFTNDLEKVSKKFGNFNNNEPGVCADYCSDVNYFGVKENHCYCLNSTAWSFLNPTQQTQCNTPCYSSHYLSCGGSSGIKSTSVYRKVASGEVHHIEGKDSYLCATLNCEDNQGVKKITLYSRDCSKNYAVVCNKQTSIEGFLNWNFAVETCKNKNDVPYVETLNGNFCSNISAAWSGVFRTILIGHLNTENSVSKVRLSCSRLVQSNIEYRYEVEEANCYDPSLVICEKNEEYPVTVGQNTQQRTVADKYSTKEIMTRSFFNISGKISNEKSPYNNIGTSTIIGIVVGVVLVAVITFVVVFLLVKNRKRLKIKTSDAAIHERTQNSYNDQIDTRRSTDNTGSNYHYDVAEPLEKGYRSGRNAAANNGFSEQMNSDDTVYMDALEGEYDTFQNKEKRKIKKDNINNLYAHTITGGNAESDYDTTHTVFENDTTTYDHSRFVGKDKTGEQIQHQEDSHYDLTHS